MSFRARLATALALAATGCFVGMSPSFQAAIARSKMPYQDHYRGVATVTGGAPGGAPQPASALVADVDLLDCKQALFVRFGDGCELRGTWSDDAQMYLDDSGAWRQGSFNLPAGQTCTLAGQANPVSLSIVSGVGRVDASRQVLLDLGGTDSSGAAVAVHLSAAPTTVPSTMDRCPRPVATATRGGS